MKNVHILPTDKPSKLFFNHNKNFEKYQFSKEPFVNGLTNTSNQNIYITSDEEIKEGDWFIDDCESDAISILYKCLEIKPFEYIRTEFNKHDFKDCKKIILTTDKDLIKDGIQAIDDEFLEWFVKNPSCEYIKTEKWLDDEGGVLYSRIIPKEEPKQETDNLKAFKKLVSGEVSGAMKDFVEEKLGKEIKQETIEEAADLWSIDTNNVHPADSYIAKKGFLAGAKLQQERSYSEEDMTKFVSFVGKNYIKAKGFYYMKGDFEKKHKVSIHQILEQFKKK
jgi:hypothetical protein